MLHWFVPWEPSITVVVCCVAAAFLYARGARRSSMTVSWVRQTLFWSGLALTYLCLHTQLDYYAEHEFFISRLQQFGLQHLGPFLIALSYPGAAFRRALPLRWRTRVLRPLLARPAALAVRHPVQSLGRVAAVRRADAVLAVAAGEFRRDAGLAPLPPDELEHGAGRLV